MRRMASLAYALCPELGHRLERRRFQVRVSSFGYEYQAQSFNL